MPLDDVIVDDGVVNSTAVFREHGDPLPGHHEYLVSARDNAMQIRAWRIDFDSASPIPDNVVNGLPALSLEENGGAIGSQSTFNNSISGTAIFEVTIPNDDVLRIGGMKAGDAVIGQVLHGDSFHHTVSDVRAEEANACHETIGDPASSGRGAFASFD